MKMFTLGLAVVTAFGAIASTAAEARPGYRPGGYGAYHRAAPVYGYRHRRGIGVGGAVAAGVAGALLGGALAATAAPQPRYRTYEEAPPVRRYYAPPPPVEEYYEEY